MNKETADIAYRSGAHIGKVHNDRYRGLYRKSASQLREMADMKQNETPLDALSTRDLQLNNLANLFALEAEDPNILFDAANNLRQAYKQSLNKDLEPIWEEKLPRFFAVLRP